MGFHLLAIRYLRLPGGWPQSRSLADGAPALQSVFVSNRCNCRASASLAGQEITTRKTYATGGGNSPGIRVLFSRDGREKPPLLVNLRFPFFAWRAIR